MRRRFFAGGLVIVAGAVMAFVPIAFGFAGAAGAALPAAAPAGGMTPAPAAGIMRPNKTTNAPAAAAAATSGVGMMTYHGGQVMHHVTAYAVYWQPPGTYMSPNYKTLINRWFGDIGSTSSYMVAQQYGDAGGPPGLDVTFGGAWTDTEAIPTTGTRTNPVTDQNLLDYPVAHALAANPTWADDNSHEIFVYLPYGVYLGAGGVVSFVDFCAFHFAYRLQGETAATHPVGAMPYVGTDPTGCGVNHNGSRAAPNGDADADSEINTTSHELFESVSDPASNGNLNTGWYYQDASHEIGDLCNFVFGPFDAQGGNMVLKGHEYVMQTEWSNLAANPANPSVANGCVMTQQLATQFDYPSGGQQNVDTTRPFTWSPIFGAQGYVVIVGTSLYGSDLLNSGVLPPSQTAFNMPALPSGRVLNATIATAVSGTWNFQPITFTAAPGQASFTYPLNGQQNVDTTRPFTWSPIPGAQGYVVIVGTTIYGADLAYSGVLGPGVTSFNMPDLPAGPVLYATVFTEVNGSWARFQVIGFIAAQGRASFTNPLNGQQNVDATRPFTWTPVAGAQGYLLAIGNAVYSADLLNSGVLPATQSSFNVPALPTGRILYALLFTEVNGVWNRYQLIGFIVR